MVMPAHDGVDDDPPPVPTAAVRIRALTLYPSPPAHRGCPSTTSRHRAICPSAATTLGGAPHGSRWNATAAPLSGEASIEAGVLSLHRRCRSGSEAYVLCNPTAARVNADLQTRECRPFQRAIRQGTKAVAFLANMAVFHIQRTGTGRPRARLPDSPRPLKHGSPRGCCRFLSFPRWRDGSLRFDD